MLTNLADALTDFGQPREAVTILERVLSDGRGKGSVSWTEHRLAEALRMEGRFREALEADRRSFALIEGEGLKGDASAFQFPLVGIGLDLLGLHRPEEAIAPLLRAVAIREKGEVQDLLAEARFGLARALWASKRDRARALDLARQARRAYEELDRTLSTCRASPGKKCHRGPIADKCARGPLAEIDRWLARPETR
jgi:tetratricopeptide (TPR) repeat protein